MPYQLTQAEFQVLSGLVDRIRRARATTAQLQEQPWHVHSCLQCGTVFKCETSEPGHYWRAGTNVCRPCRRGVAA